MSKPEWLNQVQEVAVPTSTSPDKSETAVALHAIADAMQAQSKVAAAGEVVGVVIKRAAGVQHAVAVSSGDSAADIEHLALQHGVPADHISLVSAAGLLAEQYQGTALCLAWPKEPVDVVENRVTIDMLEFLLQKRKAEGLSGDTVVALASVDNNGRSGVVSFEVRPHLAAVAKAEFDKNWPVAKFVSRGGVQVLILG